MAKKRQFSLCGMTAFGRATLSSHKGLFEVEIQGTNRRHLEITFSLPSLFLRYEGDVRKLVEEKLSRGQVNLSVKWHAKKNESLQISLNLALARGLKKAYEELKTALKIPSPLTLDHFLQNEELFILDEKIGEKEKEFLKKCVVKALSSFLAMKEKEGDHLGSDLLLRTKLIRKSLAVIESEAKEVTSNYKTRLEKRLQSYFSKDENEDQIRLLKEIALFADKADVSEEISRFHHLLDEFESTVLGPRKEGQGVGKRLEFLLQELFREINTLSSKAPEAKITRAAVDIKCELEKMREQIQNIE